MFCRASEYPASLTFSVFYHYVALNAAFLLLIGFKSPCIIIEIEWKESVLRLGKKKSEMSITSFMSIKWQFYVWTNPICHIEGILLIAVKQQELRAKQRLHLLSFWKGLAAPAQSHPCERVSPYLQIANSLCNLLQCCSPKH